VVDIGCGRGEFLTLLAENGIEAWGIESDPVLVEYLRNRHLPVKEGDMFEVLASEDGEQLGGIFAAQVIEHLSWDQLRTLLILSREKLAVGGMLLIESLNPACLSIYAESMFLDPTHIRPYHPAGIAYLCENLGFSEVDVRYVCPIPVERRVAPFSEYQHYAVIARR
jgi:O-antigen chain-terminating methyltransferase